VTSPSTISPLSFLVERLPIFHRRRALSAPCRSSLSRVSDSLPAHSMCPLLPFSFPYSLSRGRSRSFFYPPPRRFPKLTFPCRGNTSARRPSPEIFFDLFMLTSFFRPLFFLSSLLGPCSYPPSFYHLLPPSARRFVIARPIQRSFPFSFTSSRISLHTFLFCTCPAVSDTMTPPPFSRRRILLFATRGAPPSADRYQRLFPSPYRRCDYEPASSCLN